MLNQIIRVPKNILATFEDSDAVKEFESILHAGANSFIKSALICIADSQDLQLCTTQSLISGCLRSAALGLSLDPALRQAYLVPRKGLACFQPHYAGLYDLAVRTNLYRWINVSPIHRGERVLQDPQSGIHYRTLEGHDIIMSPNSGMNRLHVDRMRDVTDGRNTEPVIGYLGYFQTLKGYEKTAWMTLGEIQAHALLWSPGSYNSPKGAWQSKAKRPIMEMKTVFIALSKFMDLSNSASAKLKNALDAESLDDENAITVIPTDPDPVPAAAPVSEFPDPDLIYPAAQELIIESAAPGPSRAVPNESVSDYEWAAFTKVVERASRAGIVVRDYNRLKMTASLINGATAYLTGAIEKADKEKNEHT